MKEKTSVDSTNRWSLEQQRKFWNMWDARYLQEATLGEQAMRRGDIAVMLVRECGVESPRILELGCGNGWLAESLCQLGKVTGVDISDGAIADARERMPNGEFLVGDALSIDLPSSSFDILVALELFSHLASQKQFIERAVQWLKGGGYLILMTQNRTVYERRSDIDPPAEGQHRKWVTMAKLEAMLQPHFCLRKATTLQPSGNLGFLRIVNSNFVTRLATVCMSRHSLDQLKERCGLGQTLVVLAQKRT